MDAYYSKRTEWDEVKWSRLRVDLQEIQNNIYFSCLEGNYKKARNLMRSLVRSQTAKMLAIHSITHKNKGKFTPGIDGNTYKTSEARKLLSQEEFNYKKYKFQPVIIRYVPKKRDDFSSKRPLAIMTIKDRVMSKILSYALNACWEAKFESNVIGFRPGLSVQDAIFNTCRELNRRNSVILDADIENFFENIEHRIILNQMTLSKSIIKKMLKIKVVDNDKTYSKKKGVIQGNPLSPIIANIALHGMEKLFKLECNNHFSHLKENNIFLLRYADDFIIIAPDKKTMTLELMPRLNVFLQDRGLKLNPVKTKIVTKEEGFNFLGYHIKQTGNDLKAIPVKKGYGLSITISKLKNDQKGSS